MRLLYNPKYLGNRGQAWKSFLLGSMVVSSFIFFALTENPLICAATLALMACGFALFVHGNMSFSGVVYVYQNFFFAMIGLAVSLAFHFGGFLLFYLGIILILVLATWLHKYATPGKNKPGERPEEKREKPAEKEKSSEKPGETFGKEKPSTPS